MSMVIAPWNAPIASGARFIASKTFGHTSASSQVVSLTDLKDSNNSSVTLLQNDIVVVTICRDSTSNLGGVYPTDSGYVQVGGDIYADDVNDTNLGVAYKIMGVSPDTIVTIPGTGLSGCAVTIVALRSVNTTTPLDVAVTVATSTNTGQPNPASITPITAGALISVHVGAAEPGTSDGDLTNPGDLSSVTNHFRAIASHGSNDTSHAGHGLKLNWTSGAFDPAQWAGGSIHADSSWGAVTIAWRPA
jgi:hypothetical protein